MKRIEKAAREERSFELRCGLGVFTRRSKAQGKEKERNLHAEEISLLGGGRRGVKTSEEERPHDKTERCAQFPEERKRKSLHNTWRKRGTGREEAKKRKRSGLRSVLRYSASLGVMD